MVKHDTQIEAFEYNGDHMGAKFQNALKLIETTKAERSTQAIELMQ
ncbi:MAG: hypothetical protein ACKPKO_03560 [Candidatus Fonsibacter sp.]